MRESLRFPTLFEMCGGTDFECLGTKCRSEREYVAYAQVCGRVFHFHTLFVGEIYNSFSIVLSPSHSKLLQKFSEAHCTQVLSVCWWTFAKSSRRSLFQQIPPSRQFSTTRSDQFLRNNVRVLYIARFPKMRFGLFALSKVLVSVSITWGGIWWTCSTLWYSSFWDPIKILIRRPRPLCPSLLSSGRETIFSNPHGSQIFAQGFGRHNRYILFLV